MALGTQQYGPSDALRKFINLHLDCQNIQSFLGILRASSIRANDWEAAVKKMPSQRGSRQGNDETLQAPTTGELLSKLSESEKAKLNEHYVTKLNDALQALLDLKSEFPDQFSE